MSPPTEQIGVQSDSVVNNLILSAKKLDEAKWIYGLYGAMDGLSTSFSMLKYFFDMYYTSNPSKVSSSDALRNWSLTPTGVAFLTIESLFLIGCAIVGNTVDDDGYYLHLMSVDEARRLNYVNCFIWNEEELVYISADGTETVFNRDGDSVNLALINKIKSGGKKSAKSLHLSVKNADGLLLKTGVPFTKDAPTPSLMGSIAMYWPYARDVMKAMKNTYKGIRNTFILTDLLIPGHEYHYLAVPLGLVVGVMAAYNRTWLRKIRDERKTAKKANIELLKELFNTKKNVPINLDDYESLYSKMMAEQAIIQNKIRPPSHSQYFWLCTHLSAAISGLVDSPYLYFGALGLVVAAPTSLFFIFVATASFIFAAICICTRIYEEHNFQRELLSSQLEVELLLSVQELKLLHDNKKAIQKALLDPLSNEDKTRLESRQAALDDLIKIKWAESQLIQKKFIHQSTFSWGFILMNGLKNGLDTYGALASLMFLIATINLVIVVPYSPILVIGFVSAGLASLILFPAVALIEYYFFQAKQCVENPLLLEKDKSVLDLFSDVEFNLEGKNTIHNPRLNSPCFYDSALEVARGGCSGAGKGVRGVEQILSGAQALGEDGHYHDTASMWIFSGINALCFALTFGARGFARWGRGLKTPTTARREKSGGGDKDESVKEKVHLVNHAAKTDMPILRDNPSFSLSQSNPNPVNNHEGSSSNTPIMRENPFFSLVKPEETRGSSLLTLSRVYNSEENLRRSNSFFTNTTESDSRRSSRSSSPLLESEIKLNAQASPSPSAVNSLNLSGLRT